MDGPVAPYGCWPLENELPKREGVIVRVAIFAKSQFPMALSLELMQTLYSCNVRL